jgi:hypothetical protein
MTEFDTADVRGGRIRIPRSRGAVSGILLILLGAWGALIPMVGPYFNFGFMPDDAWNLTEGRWWFQVLPGIVTVIGGLLLLLGTDRITASIGGWLAAAAGAWYIIGLTLQPNLSLGSIGQSFHTSLGASTFERLALFEGLGALILFISAYALGRLAVVGVRDVRHARHRAERRQEMEAAAVPATDIRRREPTTVVDEATPREDDPNVGSTRLDNRNETVVLPEDRAHARSGYSDETTRLDNPDR